MLKMSLDKLLYLIDLGYGQGHWEDFRSWLWIHRKNPSPKSNQLVAPLPGYQRSFNFFAKVERIIALLCKWLGGPRLDVREQFPLWPMRHEHPLNGCPHEQSNIYVRGLLDIAEEAGIPHGWYVGTSDVPYVATMDLMCTANGDSVTSIHGISIKPHGRVYAAEPTERILERHELERRYMNEIVGGWKIADGSIMNLAFRANLLLAADAAMHREVPDTAQMEDFFQVIERSAEAGVTESIRLATHYARIPLSEGRGIFFAGIWHRRIHVDLSFPLVGKNPIRVNRVLADRLSDELFGFRM